MAAKIPLGFRAAVAAALGFEPEQVTLHNHFMGGGFGRRSNPDYAVQAALVAAQVQRPVQLIWSREEDIRQTIIDLPYAAASAERLMPMATWRHGKIPMLINMNQRKRR